ncbi:MAG: hypothetical protein LBG93_00565 [Treponema sp.]|nr:hypothetical protein [Treponema sp.]
MKIFSMKRMLSVLILAAVAVCGSLFAQVNVFQRAPHQTSEYHFFNVHIERVYAHRLGFVVIYRRGPHNFATAFIPEYWFTEAGGKGELAPVRGGTWPSMSVFTRNGEFSHVRLRVHQNRSHQTWGVVPFTVNIDEFFQGVEDIRLQF